jgi:hypothetical protein
MLKALQDENVKLKRLLAEQVMDVSTLKEMLAKNIWHLIQGDKQWIGRSLRRATRNASLRSGRSGAEDLPVSVTQTR